MRSRLPAAVEAFEVATELARHLTSLSLGFPRTGGAHAQNVVGADVEAVASLPAVAVADRRIVTAGDRSPRAVAVPKAQVP